MKFNLLFFGIFFWGQTNLNAQNNIYNADFEDGPQPTGKAQADNLDYWETRKHSDNSIDLHSPDWIYGGGNQSIITTCPAPHSGQGMIGMTNYELIQQDITGKYLEPNTYYRLSMWININTSNLQLSSNNVKLRVMLSNGVTSYQDEIHSSNLCSSNYVNFNSEASIIDIGSFDFSTLGIANNTWHKISYTFKSPSNISSFHYLGLHLINKGFTATSSSGPICENSYLFIDDMSLYKNDFCKAYCAPNLTTISYGNVPNAMVVMGSPFHLNVQNATGIEFTLFDRWGNIIAKEDAFDPNGLIDIGYPNYQFLWSGTSSDGLALFPEGVYNYILKIYNCTNTVTINNSLSYFTGWNCSTCSLISSNIHNFELNDCCINDKYIQNVTYYGTNKEGANNNIFAGSGVTTSTPYGDVVIQSGANVKFVAKNIKLTTGFTVKSGAIFKAITTEDCAYEEVFKLAKRERFDENNSKVKSSNTNSNIIIYPNPSSGIFNVSSLILKIKQIDIYNVFGQSMNSYNKTNFNSFIDLGLEKDGVYTCKVEFENGMIEYHEIIKTLN